MFDNSMNLQSDYLNQSNKYLQNASQSVPVLWNGHKMTSNQFATGWLILAPSGWNSESSHFQKIVASIKPVLYLTDYQHRDTKHYIEVVHNLPKHVLDDRILDDYCGCKAGDTVSDIIAYYKKNSGNVYLGKVDLPEIYEFAEPESEYFHFRPAAPCLKSDFSSGSVASFTNFDFYWETSTWNAFTSESDFFVSLMLPNYEVSSRIKFSDVLAELMLLPPDQSKCFPGGSTYREAANNFNSYL